MKASDPRQCPQCHQRDGYHKMSCSDPSNVARGQRVTYTGHVSGEREQRMNAESKGLCSNCGFPCSVIDDTERLEAELVALEMQRGGDDDLEQRIGKLEEQMKVIWPPELPPDPEERKLLQAEFDAAQRERHRVNRWHSTFNAALPQAMRWVYDQRCTTRENLEAAHQLASAHADRQHGPLK